MTARTASSLEQILEAKMKDRTPKISAAAFANVRDHSPYCEATGPIVGEGFVASRVRAIQGSESVTRQTRSHSPMTPCPIPRWLQIYDPIAQPHLNLKPRISIGSSREHNATMESVRQSPSCSKSNPSPLATSTVHRSSTIATTVIKTPQDLSSDEEKTILSPQAIPPGLAKPSDGWSLSDRREGDRCDGAKYAHSLRFRRSVADKLGSLVDRDWVGCDVFGKSYNDRHTSEPCIPRSHVREEESVSRNRSYSEDSHQEARPFRRRIASDEVARPALQRSTERESSIMDEDDPGVIRYTGQRKRGEDQIMSNTTNKVSDCDCTSDARGGETYDTKTADFTNENNNLCNSEAYEGEIQDTDNNSSTYKLGARTLHHPDCPKDCRSQCMQLRTLSLSQEIDRHLTEWEQAGASHVEEPKQSSRAFTYPERSSCPSPLPSRTQSSRRSNATAEQSKQMGTRAAAWFAKLAGYKLVLVDKNPVIRDLSRRISEPAMNTKRNLYQYAGPNHEKNDAISMAHIPLSRMQENVADDSTVPDHVEPLFNDQQEHKPAFQDMVNELKNGVSITATPYETKAPSASLSRLSPAQPSPPATHPRSGIRQQISPIHWEDSEVCHSTGQSSTSLHVASTTKSVQDGPKNTARQLVEDRFFGEEMTDFQRIKTPDTMSDAFRAKTPPRLPQIDEQPEESPQSVHWETAGRGRGIRRVQVIVSLDGADDLIFEAQLRRRAKKDNLAVSNGQG